MALTVTVTGNWVLLRTVPFQVVLLSGSDSMRYKPLLIRGETETPPPVITVPEGQLALKVHKPSGLHVCTLDTCT